MLTKVGWGLWLVSMLAAPCTVTASVIKFDLSGIMGDFFTLAPIGVLDGTLTIDLTAGHVIAADVTLGPPQSVNFTFVGFDGPVTDSGITFWNTQLRTSPAGPSPILVIDLPVQSLVGYAGGALCSLDAICANDRTGIVSGLFSAGATPTGKLLIGSLVPVPEPTTFLMFLCALPVLWLCPQLRRRRARGS